MGGPAAGISSQGGYMAQSGHPPWGSFSAPPLELDSRPPILPPRLMHDAPPSVCTRPSPLEYAAQRPTGPYLLNHFQRDLPERHRTALCRSCSASPGRGHAGQKRNSYCTGLMNDHPSQGTRRSQ